jgi:2-polyprenyl-3-methyl-5-hydroxy-6-metoxy-1,4-benzoquinol methylase
VHNRVAESYDRDHGEIFNEIEQNRLAHALSRAAAAVRTGVAARTAMDFGCGSGNLTRHLLRLGLNVVAADVAPRLLQLVERRFSDERLTTLKLNGVDLREVPDNSFDIVATYSVLHHVPDYLAAVREMARTCKRGGVVYIDHEHTDEFWQGKDPVYSEFKGRAPTVDWQKFLRPSNYLHKVRRLFNPRYTNEGDIHVWPDDHIEWKRIEQCLLSAGFEVIHDEKFLLFKTSYKREVFQAYSSKCSDTRVMAFRKK